MKLLYNTLLFLLSITLLPGPVAKVTATPGNVTTDKTTLPILNGTASGIRNDTTLAARWIRIDSVNIPIQPPSSGVTCYRDGIIFLSSTKHNDIIPQNHISFGRSETMFTTIMDGKTVKASPFSPSADFNIPGDAITFTKDYKTMYYTRFERDEGYERIYRGDYTEGPDGAGYWTLSSEPLPFCTGKASYTHPALSADGKLMVFASNRQGTLGGMDLFVTMLKDGEWSEPVNMGDAVNSRSNELFPYLDSENNLYFSSDGIQGFGGYDIYVCRFRSNTWEKPVNLQPPINTKWDDIAFTVERSSGKTAFYTVRQNMGKKSQQLHMISMNESIPDTLINLSQYFTSPEISGMIILALEPAVQATDIPENKQTAGKIISGSRDKITYRVQFMTSFNPHTRTTIEVKEKNYDVYEFLFAGAYRLCVGEYSDLSKAVEVQNLLKQNNYPGASVLAFVNNELSLDPDLLTAEAAATKEAEKDMTKKEEARNEETKIAEAKKEKARIAEAKKEEARLAEARKEETKMAEAKKAETRLIEAKKEEARAAEAKAGAKEETKEEVAVKVIYRVQLISNTTQKGSYTITIGGMEYTTWEYKYAGAWRTTAGEFSKLSDAIALQRLARQEGFNQAFVAAFVDNVRSTDPALFK